MPKTLPVLLLLLTSAAYTQQPVRVLFLGNSLTYSNDLPKMFQSLSKTETGSVTQTGATLQVLYEQTKAREVLKGQRWDFVVLQDQSSLGVSYLNGRLAINEPEAFQMWARIWDREIRAAGAKPVFFLTWARKDSPEDQNLLDYAYMSTALDLQDAVAPVGIAWHRMVLADPAVPLYAADGQHPTPAGTYLAACVIMDTLLQQVCGDPQDKMPPDLVARIRTFSRDTALQVRRAGGQLLLRKPPFAAVPVPAPAGNVAPEQLNGTWTGEMKFYNAPATVELTLEPKCKVTWKATIPGGVFHVAAAAASCAYTGNGVRFLLALPNGTFEDHQAILQGGALTAVVKAFTYTAYSRREGTWTMHR